MDERVIDCRCRRQGYLSLTSFDGRRVHRLGRRCPSIVHAGPERTVRATNEAEALIKGFAARHGDKCDGGAGKGSSIEVTGNRPHQRIAVTAPAKLRIDDQIGQIKVQDTVPMTRAKPTRRSSPRRLTLNAAACNERRAVASSIRPQPARARRSMNSAGVAAARIAPLARPLRPPRPARRPYWVIFPSRAPRSGAASPPRLYHTKGIFRLDAKGQVLHGRAVTTSWPALTSCREPSFETA